MFHYTTIWFLCLIQNVISTLHICTFDTCIVYMCMQLLHVYVTVKNSSVIVAVENILVLRLCCDLMMAWTMRRNGVI